MKMTNTPTPYTRMENLIDALVQSGVDVRVKCYDYKPELWRNGMYQLTHDLTSACNVKEIVSVGFSGTLDADLKCEVRECPFTAEEKALDICDCGIDGGC